MDGQDFKTKNLTIHFLDLIILYLSLAFLTY